MRKLLENYRGFEFVPLVYLAGTAEIKSETTQEGVEEWKLPEITFTKEDTPNSAWDKIDKIYNPKPKGPYYGMIKKYVDGVMPDSTDKSEKERWLDESMRDFKSVYTRVNNNFLNEESNLKKEYSSHLNEIEAQTRLDLNKLKEIIEKKKKTVEAKEDIVGKEGDEETEASPKLANAPAIKDKFSSYLQSQNDLYLNEGIQEARLNNIDKRSRTKLMRNYKKNAELFKTAMERRTMARLDYHLSQKDIPPETIEKSRELIGLEYKHFAGLDNNKGFIDIGDFQIMEKYSDVNFNLMTSVQKSSDRQDNLYMESMYILKYEVWENTTESARKMMVTECYNNASEGSFIVKVNEYREKAGLNPVENFEEAKAHFETLIQERTRMGVSAVHGLLSDFKTAVYADRLKNMKKVKPESLQLMVFREREFLLSRRLIPLTEHDTIIVEFMSTNRQGRESILQNKKAVLFKAIKNIKYHYPKYIKDNFKGISKKPGELRYQPNLAKRPTRDDKAARMYALMTLASEAEGLVNNFSKTEKYKGQNLEGQLKKVKEDKNAPVVGLKFKDAMRSKTSPFTSALSRGGFNGRDLGIKVLKVLGAMAFFANIANSIKSAEGKDIFGKTADALGKIATNPGVYIGAAAFGGAQFVEQHPRYLEYPFASAHEKLDINAGRKLAGIKKQVGSDNVDSFLQRGNPLDNNSPLSKEWLVMDKISSRKLERLVDKAKKKPHPKLGPIIENKDIEKLIPMDQRHVVMAGLNRSKINAQTRFLFYEKFLYGQEMNVQQLRNVTTD